MIPFKIPINKTTVGITIILLLLTYSGIQTYRAYSFKESYLFEQNEKENVQKAYSQSMAEVEIYKNRFNHFVTRNEALELDNKNLSTMVKEGYLKHLKELEGVKKNLKNVEFVYRITAKALDSAMVKLKDTTKIYVDVKGDTVYYRVSEFHHKDQWAQIDEEQISPFESKVTYSVTVPLTGAMFWDRKWFLGKKSYWGEATSENPHVTIPELVNIKVGRGKRK